MTLYRATAYTKLKQRLGVGRITGTREIAVQSLVEKFTGCKGELYILLEALPGGLFQEIGTHPVRGWQYEDLIVL